MRECRSTPCNKNGLVLPKTSTGEQRVNEMHASALGIYRYMVDDFYREPIEGSFYESELQLVADKDFFPVEKVLKVRKTKGKVEKLVKFMGYKEPRWMPADSLMDI